MKMIIIYMKTEIKNGIHFQQHHPFEVIFY